MNQQDLKDILDKHRKWVNKEPEGERAILDETNLRGAYLSEGADLSGADLSGADLSGAYLRGADLSLKEIQDDYFSRLALVKTEVSGLYKALIDGRINGSLYEGECACFVGTIAKLAGKKYTDLSQLKPNSESFTEKWFLGIAEGDTPVSNPISRITAEWTMVFMKSNGIKVPIRTVTWGDET